MTARDKMSSTLTSSSYQSGYFNGGLGMGIGGGLNGALNGGPHVNGNGLHAATAASGVVGGSHSPSHHLHHHGSHQHHHSSHHHQHHHQPHYPSHPCFTKKTPKRYFNLGLFCCCTAGFVFTFGLILMVWGSSPHEANAIWIAGIVFLFTGGALFFMGIGSIGLYLSREDRRKRKEELERGRARQYAASLASARSFARSSDVYLID